jgi:hypothetical protein
MVREPAMVKPKRLFGRHRLLFSFFGTMALVAISGRSPRGGVRRRRSARHCRSKT